MVRSGKRSLSSLTVGFGAEYHTGYEDLGRKTRLADGAHPR